MNGVIAVASGKGGTGKTTIAVNLAASWPGSITLLDCDVEDPNAHLFLCPEWENRKRFAVPVPVFDFELCDGCGLCRDACRFNALAIIDHRPLLFPELCHSCGVCKLVCPRAAVTEVPREIGTLEWGRSNSVYLIQGCLDIGEAKSPPLIKAVRKAAGGGPMIIDAPPGTSCPVVASIQGVDYLLLVGEPTPFGIHDLSLAIELAGILGLPYGVVVNRSGPGDAKLAALCKERRAPVLAWFPYDLDAARAYSRGQLPIEALPEYRQRMESLWRVLEGGVPA